MTWITDLPAYVFLISSCLLFSIGITLLWVAHHQKKYLKLDTQLASFTSTGDQIGAGEKSFTHELLSPGNVEFLHGSREQGRLFGRVSSWRNHLIRQIEQAGFTGTTVEIPVYACMILAGVIGGILAFNLKIGLSLLDTGYWALFLDVGFFTALFSISPVLGLRFLVRKRREELEQYVPDLIDLLVLCVGTGLTLEAGLRKVTEAMANMSPVLSAEMKTMLNELRILPDKSSAFINLQNRTSSDGLKYLFMALHQSEIYGTSVATALQMVAMDNRKRRMISLENTAARLPVLMSLPLIIFILPPVIAISAGPGFTLMLRTIGN